MGTSMTAVAGRRRGSLVGIVWLVAVLMAILGLTVAFTGYLFRSGSRLGLSALVVPTPRPYAVSLIQGADLLVAVDGHVERVAGLPQAVARGVRATIASPDGRRLLVVSAGSGGDRLWLLGLPAGELSEVALPPAGPGGRRYVTARWTADGVLTVILAVGTQANGALTVARIASRGVLQGASPWALPKDPPGGAAAIVSLSSDAAQVAVVERLPGSVGFQPQVMVTLRHLLSARASVAYRYLGAGLPSAVLWSPDDGTVAIAAPGTGLAIQKASGRPVRLVGDGVLPGAFSPRIARLCYLTGGANGWRFHVLDLHSESDAAVGPSLPTRPDWAGWTPDGRAILYTLGGRLWELRPVEGTERLVGPAPGTPIGVAARQ